MELRVSMCLAACTVIHNCSLPVVSVRLSNGDNIRSGRVEMYINGQWGTVCDDNWTTGSSTVLCRQLGLGNTGALSYYNEDGSSSYPIYLDNIMCNGSEVNILACPHSRLHNHNCSHGDDVGVTCSGLYSKMAFPMYLLIPLGICKKPNKQYLFDIIIVCLQDGYIIK